MRIGILSFVEANNNAGALLQAYALQQCLRGMGHDPEVLRFPVYRDHRHLRNLWIRMRQRGHWLEQVESYWRYDLFRRRQLRRSAQCRTGEELCAQIRKYEALITGSDQVWNEGMAFRAFQRRPDYGFLSFAARRPVRRIAYAACAGMPTSSAASHVYAPYWLNQFDAISVRNQATQELVADWLDGRQVPVTCDPVFLEDFSGFANLQPQGLPTDYILVYAFPSTVESLGNAVLQRMQQELKSPVLVIPPADFQVYDFPGGDRYIRHLDPRGWVALIAHAKAFLTNSFHGMAMASKLGTPFVAFYESHSPIAYRLDDIADRYGLRDRVVNRIEDITRLELAWEEENKKSAAEAIRRHAEASRMFLQNALENIQP